MLSDLINKAKNHLELMIESYSAALINKRQSNELKLYSEILDMFSTLISISMMKVPLV